MTSPGRPEGVQRSSSKALAGTVIRTGPRQRSWRGPCFDGCPIRNEIWLFLLLLIVLFSGCADFQAPTAKEALSQPFGTGGPFTRGSTKAQILEAWGPPHQVIPRGVDELGTAREEWIYKGAIPALPIDYEYVSRTKHLFFEGNTLVNWNTED